MAGVSLREGEHEKGHAHQEEAQSRHHENNLFLSHVYAEVDAPEKAGHADVEEGIAKPALGLREASLHAGLLQVVGVELGVPPLGRSPLEELRQLLRPAEAVAATTTSAGPAGAPGLPRAAAGGDAVLAVLGRGAALVLLGVDFHRHAVAVPAGVAAHLGAVVMQQLLVRWGSHVVNSSLEEPPLKSLGLSGWESHRHKSPLVSSRRRGGGAAGQRRGAPPLAGLGTQGAGARAAPHSPLASSALLLLLRRPGRAGAAARR